MTEPSDAAVAAAQAHIRRSVTQLLESPDDMTRGALRAAYEVELGKTFVPLADAAAWLFLHTSHEVFEAFEDRFGRFGDEDES